MLLWELLHICKAFIAPTYTSLKRCDLDQIQHQKTHPLSPCRATLITKTCFIGGESNSRGGQQSKRTRPWGRVLL